jgi:UDP-4-amino-4,6-dideoxy-N-acetyl-beta-L-altrosamine transaminase
MKAIPYGRQEITDSDIEAIASVLRSDYLTQGPEIALFEEKFAAYVQAKYAVAVSNGTAALHLAAMALGVNENSRVITTPITFSASANCIRYCGGEVHFADIDKDSYLLDINKVRELLEKHPKGYFQGIVPVDFTGNPVNLEEFRNLCDEHCHSPGGYFTNSKGEHQYCGNGRFAELAVFSFHPVKHVATGEGGMITTDSKELYEKLLVLRTHGITKDADRFLLSPEEISQGGWYHEMQTLGYNYRLTDFQAALGISQLSRAEENMVKRRKLALRYDEAFTGTAIRKAPGNEGHAYHLYVIQAEDRKGLYDYLRTKNIFTQVHYIPAHRMPYYREQGWKKGDMPVAEEYYEHCLSLPMYPSLTDAEQEYVIECILSWINTKA